MHSLWYACEWLKSVIQFIFPYGFNGSSDIPSDKPQPHPLSPAGWPAPLYNLYFDSFLLICTSFVVRTRGIVCVVYLLFRLANYKDPCKRCVLALISSPTSFWWTQMQALKEGSPTTVYNTALLKYWQIKELLEHPSVLRKVSPHHRVQLLSNPRN